TPEFTVDRKNVTVIVVESLTGRSENMRQADVISDQTVYGVRIASSYFTFYKTVIPAEYWNKLDLSLPQNEFVVIKRWLEGERPETGLDIAKPNGR
ncbi:6767_t:CDS:2, partial [Scutellospora calospora]